jgi:hypothetical protein
MATAPSPNDLTRQQLDELDTLLQRMLSLPLNPADGGTPTPAPATSWRVDPPAPAAAPAPHIAAPPLPPDPPMARAPVVAEPIRPPRPAPMPPPNPPATTGAFNPAPPPRAPAPPAAVPEPRFEPPSPFEEMAPVRPEPAAVREEESSPVPVALWPLVALNWTVDLLLGLLGPPGRFLRSGIGKYLLGLAGLALLIYTAAHVADEKGWLTPPFPVPWPR